MSERALTWAPRLAASLRGAHASVAAVHRARARATYQAIRRTVPRRTGHLARSLALREAGTTSAITYPAEYRALDEGGVVRPQHGAWLAVPIGPHVRARSPREDGRLIVIRRSDGRLYLLRRRGRVGEIRWRLVAQIRQRATGFASRPIALATPITTRELEAQIVRSTT